MRIPKNHPRAESLRVRELIIEGMHQDIVAEAGLIAHGRGEAFDYLIGEKTPSFAIQQQTAAVAMILLAKKAIISVNGNIASLCSEELVKLADILSVNLEVNLFYRREERSAIVAKKLQEAGAKNILGKDPEFYTTIEELSHSRRVVDKRGIFSADVILVPLEDGDRTMALRKMGKRVITIDLNPLSRTSIWSNITIVNNVIRAIPEMVSIAEKLRNKSKEDLLEIVENFDNHKSLQESLLYISQRLNNLAEGELEKPKVE
ncbi:MAG: phosphopantothenate/pantothenate synthetase [Candidatus Heimdallarchaeota archaeon]|nr:phosphopantothenate/pantothenate synthetase [Candidatus Heimdallarchaeota archaeon]MCG3258007.1 phosphopantothenate/pantothenate synthetase [Candidatus Heimdallarchaeota archaeon]MCK4613056.1 phosphopantothenate/pantothenate synthetase [Candidatus Heimdallarchaeota archaeon]